MLGATVALVAKPPSEKLMKSIRHARIKRQANPETHNIQ
jgi:hypothetical protein